MAVTKIVVAALCIVGVPALNIHKADECQCLNWAETYSSGLAECGQGFEFTRLAEYSKADYGTPEEWLKHVKDLRVWGGRKYQRFGRHVMHDCSSFYLMFDDNKCARTAMGSGPTDWWEKSWCYVSPKCKSAMATGSGQEVGLVSAKLCEEGKDPMLSDMDPEALIAYGKKMDFWDPGYLVKIAYPVADRSYDNAKPEQIKALKASGTTVLVDNVYEYQTKIKMITPGGKVYSITSAFDDFSCVEGCA